MRIEIHCPECGLEHRFVLHLLPKNDCAYELKCPRGHTFMANVLYHEFQKLFEIAIDSLANQQYRESIGSFAASYERFMELFIRIVMRAAAIDSNLVVSAWKKIEKQSERQLGAFIYLYMVEFKQMPPLLNDKLVNVRNRVIHQGYFPDEKECMSYGKSVLQCIQNTIGLIYSSEKLRDELIKAINENGDFSQHGPRLHYYAYPLIGTNRSPNSDLSFEDMLKAAADGRAF